MRKIRLVRLDKIRPALVLTRPEGSGTMSKVTIAPITSTIKGLSSELPLGERNGLDHACAASLDTTMTIPVAQVGRTIGYLLPRQERALAQAVVHAFDLDATPFG